MKLTKFGILVNETTSLFTSIRDSKISRGCEKILEIPEGRGGGKFWGPILENPKGRGVIRQIPSVGVVWNIFWKHTISLCVRMKYFAPSVEQKRDLD